MTQLRTDLIKMLAHYSEDHVKTLDRMEAYIKERETIAYNRGLGTKVFGVEPTSESRAYSLYCAGKHFTDIIEILSDEYPELDGDQIEKIVNDAKERFDERDVPLENTTNE